MKGHWDPVSDTFWIVAGTASSHTKIRHQSLLGIKGQFAHQGSRGKWPLSQWMWDIIVNMKYCDDGDVQLPHWRHWVREELFTATWSLRTYSSAMTIYQTHSQLTSRWKLVCLAIYSSSSCSSLSISLLSRDWITLVTCTAYIIDY